MIEHNKDITHLTTFGVPACAKHFAEYSSVNELVKISREPEFMEGPVLQIGGGSNLLFLSCYSGLVLHSGIKGIVRYDKDADTAFAIVGAGEKWDDFVNWAIDNNLAGVENLAGIPGEVGASPVQNVGAYGVEAKDVVHAVECFDMQTRKVRRFTNGECAFGYRDSFFKHEGKGRFIVLRVSFKLNPDGVARHLDYGPFKDFADSIGHAPSLREVAEEVRRIRDRKLPDPRVLGSAGSFFKNPVLHDGRLKEIKALTGAVLRGYPVGEDLTKVSAAWLIDNAGMKGRTCGDAQVHVRQPLVIVNRGHADSRDVVELAGEVQREVRRKFLIDLVPEVNYIDTDVHVTILGTGTSKGIPEIGCDCSVCTSPFIKDKRTRTSALIETMGLTILIDPSPDFREQALREGIHHIDAVLVTHSHYDHVGGIDDLRPFCAGSDLRVYLNEATERNLRQHYDYCFRKNPYPGVPSFDMKTVGTTPFYIDGVRIEPIEVLHGQMPILGFRIGKFAYITDAKYISDSEKEKLEGLDTLILNALRDRDHFSHFTLKEALQLVEEIRPRQTFLTHFNHEIGRHADLARRLPDGVHPAYDGMKIEIDR